MKTLGTLLTDTILIPDRREVWEWAADHVDFGNNAAFKGRYDVENVPWTKEILRAAKNPWVREITVVMPPQDSGKTKAAEVYLCWRICNDPAPCAFNPVTNVKAEQWADTRWTQMLKACPAVSEKFSDNRHDKKKRRIIFRDGSFLLIQGAELEANRQSDSVEVQVNDECNLWEKPWMAQMHNRLRAYAKTKKVINIGVGGDVGSEQHERFASGTQMEWSHHCPACEKPFQYVFNHRSPRCNIKFELPLAKMHADGRLDLTDFAKTIKVVCPQQHCAHEMFWDEDRLLKQNRNGVYVAQNPDANPEIVSFHANSFALGRKSWVKILEPWVRLNMKGGIFASEVLKEFITQELAEFWEDKPIAVSKDLKLGSYTRSEMLKPGVWKDEWIRVMAVDNQRGSNADIAHRWFVCRALSRDGKSRLVDCGRLNEWEQIRDKQRELGIPEWSSARPGPWVVVDRAYNPVEVDEICSRMKWFGLLGQDTEEFLHGPRSVHSGQRMLFSEERLIDVGYGTAESGRTFSVYYLWSSQKVQDLLAALRNTPVDWQLPSDLNDFCPEYADHINSHRQKMRTNPRTGEEKMIWEKIGGWPDHMLDCESLLVVLGLMAGVFKKE